MGSAQLGIVIVVMVMGASPNAAGAECQDAKDAHQTFGETGAGQDRVVLLIMINHEKSQNQQSGEKAAADPDDKRKLEKSPPEGGRQKKRS